MPLDTSARLAKPETAVSKTPQQQDLAVLLHHLETGETKTRGERCPILKSASQVTFLEGKPSDETLLVGLLKENVWGLTNWVSLRVW